MKIINTGLQYFPNNVSDGAYRGTIEMSRDEFYFAVKQILKNKDVSKSVNGSGKYPYLSKDLLVEDMNLRKKEYKDYTLYALRVGFADYITNLFSNDSKRFKYKRQNYIIKVIKNYV